MSPQHRLSRIQLVNWGTFSNYHDLPVPRSGMLVTGPSGSGKSTLLDAMSTLLVPPKWSSFNAAAQQSGRGDRSRTVASYIRGAYRRDTDEDSGQLAVTYLRKGATWSAVALSFTSDDGRVTTIGQLFHLQRGHVSPGDVRHLYFQAPEDVSLIDLTPFAENGIDPRGLKSAHPSWTYATSYAAFAAHLYRRFNLSGEQALRLLHKTQSSKNLNNLNTLLREFMLDQPDTFALADQAVDQFAELSTAHAAVVDARRQVETLRPLRALVDRHDEAAEELGRLAAQQLHLERYLVDARVAATESALEALASQRLALEGEVERAAEAAALAQAHRDDCQRRVDGVSGDLAILDDLLAEVGTQVSRAEQARRRAETLAERVGLALPATAEEHTVWRTELVRERESLDLAAVGRMLNAVMADQQRERARVGELEQELQTLDRYRSNLGANLVRVQNLLARELNVDRSRLQFAGELIDLRPEDVAWQGPIERVLRPLAQTLLVPDDLYRPVADLVNRTQLGTRLVYTRMEPRRGRDPGAPSGRSLLRKIRVGEGEQHDWLWDRLRQQYDYDCVDTAAELVGVNRGVTTTGQIKHGGSRHEKDDRSRVDDRSRWILGSSVEGKKAAVAELLAAALERVRAAEAAVERAQTDRDRLRDRQGWLDELVDLGWEELDVAPLRARLTELEAESERRRAATTGLAELERELTAAAQALEEAHGVRRAHETKLDRNADHRAEAEHRLARWRTEAAQKPVVPDDVRELLVREWPLPDSSSDSGTIDRIDTMGHTALRAITDRRVDQQSVRDKAIGQTSRVMAAYKNEWRARAADLAPEMTYASDYLAVLDELEADGLPQHEDHFFTLLQSQSRNNIGALSLKIKNSRREVRQRIAPINESLRRTDFSPGEHLEIRVAERSLPAVAEFLRELHEITADTGEDAPDGEAARVQAEARFTRMKALLDRLASSETVDTQWRTQCLDTRLHVEFRAVVLDAEGQQTNVYEDSGGLSGGERQKLVTFCLAAALRYQLARDGAELPEYALVILDEAFDKTDPEFTRAGLEVFRAFGFQLLLATPLKMLQTLEDYVGGVAYVSNPEGAGSRLAVMPFEEESPEPAMGPLGS